MSSPRSRARLIAAAALLIGAVRAAAGVSVEVDLGRVTKAGVAPAGLNLCWLLDSDRIRREGTPTSTALAELHPGALRFPYGHLADNYLWHTPAGEVPSGKLRPKVASLRTAPGDWSWAVKPDGSMPDAMDFDEFLRVCAKVGAKPVVCVNALSYGYAGGPTYEALKASAVAWVKYAARQPVRVAYWEIGNEVDLKPNAKVVSQDAYVKLYADFARAMKAADPTAKIGPGINGNANYYSTLMRQCPELVDFAVVHQYEWSQKQCASYAGWRDDDGTYIPNIERAAKALEVPGRAPVKLLVTETGVSGGAALGETANTYKALWLAELLCNELAHPAVEHSLFWGTHTPWRFEGYDHEPARDVALVLRQRDNVRTPMGEVLKLINENLLPEFVTVPRVSGRLRTYATRSATGAAVTVFLLNKDDQPLDVTVRLQPAEGLNVTGRREFAGRTPDDLHPVVHDRDLPRLRDGALGLVLAPLSLTVVRLGQSHPIP